MSNRRHPVEVIVERGQCMGCGLCTLVRPEKPGKAAPRIEMTFDPAHDQFVPTVTGWAPGDPPGSFVCPGAQMDMPALAKAVHGHEPTDPMLGEVVALRAGYATDPELRDRAASGGVVPAILAHLFETGQIDVAYCVRSTGAPRESRGAVLRSAGEIATIHGSVYHPARFGEALSDLAAGSERFALVGLPCEIAGFEMLKAQLPGLRKRHVLSIGLFCGGINSFTGIDYYLSHFGVRLDDVASIDYRHGRWPGGIRAVLRNGSVRKIARIAGNSRFNILKYVIAFQGYWMLPRCRICPDQVSDFADIAVGDPHLPRFRKRDGGFSVIVTRTARGEATVKGALAAGRMSEEAISRDEVVNSQGYTLDNRRHAMVYARVARKLGMVPPEVATYAALEKTRAARHYRYAFVDLVKLRLPKNRLLQMFYLPWQIFEYLFITFTPTLIGKRLAKLLKNEGGA